jgi:hypothetical protein
VWIGNEFAADCGGRNGETAVWGSGTMLQDLGTGALIRCSLPSLHISCVDGFLGDISGAALPARGETMRGT